MIKGMAIKKQHFSESRYYVCFKSNTDAYNANDKSRTDSSGSSNRAITDGCGYIDNDDDDDKDDDRINTKKG